MTPGEAVKLAVDTLRAAGIEERHMVIAITDPYARGRQTIYQTFVGACEDRDDALLLSSITETAHEEATQQSRMTWGPDRCPDCKSNRYGIVQHPDRRRLKLNVRRECLACGHKGPWR